MRVSFFLIEYSCFPRSFFSFWDSFKYATYSRHLRRLVIISVYCKCLTFLRYSECLRFSVVSILGIGRSGQSRLVLAGRVWRLRWSRNQKHITLDVSFHIYGCSAASSVIGTFRWIYFHFLRPNGGLVCMITRSSKRIKLHDPCTFDPRDLVSFQSKKAHICSSRTYMHEGLYILFLLDFCFPLWSVCVDCTLR